jgi:coenzyme F420 hydrogenase subunit beta
MADISVGNVGSDPGTSTVLIRTDAGRDAWQKAASSDAFTAEPLEDLSAVWALRDRNAERAKRNLQREYDPEGDLWISYHEHLETYGDSERAPEPVPPHRSHHYDVAC